MSDVGPGPHPSNWQSGWRATAKLWAWTSRPAMVAAVTRRAAAAGVPIAPFVVADAQREVLGADFAAAYSRFGVMFCSDPVTAFANIARSLRTGGRLACAVWGPLTDNPWMFVPTLAAAEVLKTELNIPGPDEPGPFSRAEGERVHHLLNKAGFSDVTVERVDGSRLVNSGDAGGRDEQPNDFGAVGE